MTTPERREQMARAQAARRQREEQQGVVRILVKVPVGRRDELLEIAGQWLLDDLAPQHVVED